MKTKEQIEQYLHDQEQALLEADLEKIGYQAGLVDGYVLALEWVLDARDDQYVRKWMECSLAEWKQFSDCPMEDVP